MKWPLTIFLVIALALGGLATYRMMTATKCHLWDLQEVPHNTHTHRAFVCVEWETPGWKDEVFGPGVKPW